MENVERGSIASFGSGNTTDSDHLRGEKVRIILKIAKIAHYLMYFAACARLKKTRQISVSYSIWQR
jgi:hypothetical protein